MLPKTVFQIKKLTGWDDIEVKDIKRGQSFRVLVNDTPIVQENGGTTFIASFDAFQDYEGVWRVAVS